MKLRKLCFTLFVLAAALVSSPLAASPSDYIVPWPQLYTIVNGSGVIDLKKGERIDFLVTVFVNCSSAPCRFQTFIHWVKAQPDYTLTYLATTAVAELNAHPEERIARVTFDSMDGCFVFELGDGHPIHRLFLSAGEPGKYHVTEIKGDTG